MCENNQQGRCPFIHYLERRRDKVIEDDFEFKEFLALQDTIASDFCQVLNVSRMNTLQAFDINSGFPDPFNGQRTETLEKAALLGQKFSAIPFLRSVESSIALSYYNKVPRHVTVMPMIPVNVVRPKAVRAPVDKENLIPIGSKRLDNPEDFQRRDEKPYPSKTFGSVAQKAIASTEAISCMEYPARFAPFINNRCKLQDSQVHMLRPLEKASSSNKLSQSTIKTHDLDRNSMQLCVEMAQNVLNDSPPRKSMFATGRII